MRLKIIKVLCFILASYALARFSHHQTAGFRMSKIRHSCGPDVGYRTQTPSKEIINILQGPFTFLGRGLQSFAFVSEDGKYVLKIFNNRLQRKLFWANLFKDKEKADRITTKLKETFESYKIAYEDLHEETAMLYLHPLFSGSLPRTTLIDKLGIAHSIELNEIGFVLQKRATLVYPWLQTLIDNNEIETAKKGIHALLELFLYKFQRGIADNDPLIRTNFGFIDGIPIQIDIGPFSKNLALCNKTIYLKEIKRITASLNDWLEHKSPELAEHLQTLINRLTYAP